MYRSWWGYESTPSYVTVWNQWLAALQLNLLDHSYRLWWYYKHSLVGQISMQYYYIVHPMQLWKGREAIFLIQEVAYCKNFKKNLAECTIYVVMMYRCTTMREFNTSRDINDQNSLFYIQDKILWGEQQLVKTIMTLVFSITLLGHYLPNRAFQVQTLI